MSLSIGFWAMRRGDSSRLPWPGDRVDPMYSQTEPEARRLVLAYLRRPAFKGVGWRGTSRCRFCDTSNGSHDFTDGTYTWPEGYAHYIERHDVVPEPDFVAHVLSSKPAPEPSIAERIMEGAKRGTYR
jgi:hypothetical protein